LALQLPLLFPLTFKACIETLYSSSAITFPLAVVVGTVGGGGVIVGAGTGIVVVLVGAAGAVVGAAGAVVDTAVVGVVKIFKSHN